MVDTIEDKLTALLDKGYMVLFNRRSNGNMSITLHFEPTPRRHIPRIGWIEVIPPNTLANCLDTLLEDA